MHTTAHVCCTEEDRWIAEQIADALKEHGLSAWTYWSAIDAEGDLGQQVQQGIEQSEASIMTISPGSVKTRSAATELGIATALGKTVISVATHEPPVDEVWRLRGRTPSRRDPLDVEV